jgi:hypothetical protein
VLFTGGTREYRGKAALKAFLDWAHDGVREVMRPQNVLQQGDLLFADVDMDFHASKERPDFPFGHLRPGDLVTVKFFVTYRIRNGKVVELKSMTWPPAVAMQLPRSAPSSQPPRSALWPPSATRISSASSFYTEDVR